MLNCACQVHTRIAPETVLNLLVPSASQFSFFRSAKEAGRSVSWLFSREIHSRLPESLLGDVGGGRG